jgi:hypothetical protein
MLLWACIDSTSGHSIKEGGGRCAPAPPQGNVFKAEQVATKKEQRYHIRWQRSIGNFHAGCQNGRKERQRDANAQGTEVHKPEKQEASIELDHEEHKHREQERREDRNEDLIKKLVQQVSDGFVQAIAVFPCIEWLLQSKRGHIARCTKPAQQGASLRNP